MTAPTRTSPTRDPQRTRGAATAPAKPRRSPGTARPRSAAAAKAYAKRAHRSEKLDGRVPPAGQRQRAHAGPRTARQASTASFVLVLMALLVVGVGATLWLSTQATADSYTLEHAKDRTTALSQQKEMLQQQVAAADSTTSLARRAHQLGMVPATDPAHLLVKPDGSVRVIGTPLPAGSPGSAEDSAGGPGSGPDQD